MRRRYRGEGGEVAVRPPADDDDVPLPKSRASWAKLLRMVFEVDPLTCRRCGAELRVIAVITTPALIDRLLRHVREKGAESAGDSFDARAPPAA